jgi:SAM-dependent methyltransferase
MEPIEELIYNKGERLIPGVSHNADETRRHMASYEFFKKLITEDLVNGPGCAAIVDLGCGVGFGCKILSDIPNSLIFGADNSKECIDYAQERYAGKNIVYEVADLHVFIPVMPEFDYAVSRGVFEHIKDGLELASKVNFRRLFVFDVPYDEAVGNPHHMLTGITEESFKALGDVEIFYEDIRGNISKNKSVKPNMVACVCRRKST